MPKIDIGPKQMIFMVEAIEFRIRYYEDKIAAGGLSDDEYTDFGNDSQLLKDLAEFIRREYEKISGDKLPDTLF